MFGLYECIDYVLDRKQFILVLYKMEDFSSLNFNNSLVVFKYSVILSNQFRINPICKLYPGKIDTEVRSTMLPKSSLNTFLFEDSSQSKFWVYLLACLSVWIITCQFTGGFIHLYSILKGWSDRQTLNLTFVCR